VDAAWSLIVANDTSPEHVLAVTTFKYVEAPEGV
jgi:hypothetical protein